MQSEIRTLTDAEIHAVSGGENPKGGGGDVVGWLTQVGGTIVGALERAGKAILSKL